MDFTKIMEYIESPEFIAQVLEVSKQLAIALLILGVGFWLAGKLTKILDQLMTKSKVDKTLKPFMLSLVSALLKIMVVIAAATQVGIETTSFLAILGAAGLAIGLALQGSLQNFSAGAMILIFKPYKVGDLVELQGYVGHVQEIQIFNTVLTTLDSKKVIVPNAAATSGPITNMTSLGKIRIDMVFGIAYSANIDKAREVILALAATNDKIMKNPGISVTVIEHGASSVNLAVRPHVDAAHYWDVYFFMHEEIKKAFDREGIEIPYNTMDVNIISGK